MVPGFARFVVSVAVAYWFFRDGAPTPSQLGAIQAAITSASGTLLGFVITSAAILLALPDRPLVDNMRKTGHLHNLLVQLVLTGGVLLVLLVCSILGNFVIDFAAKCLATATVFFGVWAIQLVIAVGRKFHLVATFVARS